MGTECTSARRAVRCARNIDKDLACRLGNDRMAYMNTRKDCGGPSLLEMLWERLLEQYGFLMTFAERVQDYAEHETEMPADERERGTLAKGRAQGLAEAIAVITNPYIIDVDAVRAEAAKRYAAQEAADAEFYDTNHEPGPQCDNLCGHDIPPNAGSAE